MCPPRSVITLPRLPTRAKWSSRQFIDFDETSPVASVARRTSAGQRPVRSQNQRLQAQLTQSAVNKCLQRLNAAGSFIKVDQRLTDHQSLNGLCTSKAGNPCHLRHHSQTYG
jgi:hypothetical protein